MKKIVVLLALLLCLSITAGCSSSKQNGRSGDTTATAANATSAAETTEASDTLNLIESKEALAQKLPNYSCEIHATNNGSETSVLTYKVHPDGVAFKPSDKEDSIMIYDNKNKKIYMLNEKEKTGLSRPDDGKSGSFIQPATYFMAWSEIDKSLLKKVSSVNIDGRDAVMYTHSILGVELRYTIDKEYGICLSYEMRQNGKTSTKWEMKNFKVGNVTAADVTVPADYTITDIPS